jgi:sugar fermentation stimulation protein A
MRSYVPIRNLYRSDSHLLVMSPDPSYAQAFEAAQAAGVERLVYDTVISPQSVQLGRALPPV